MNELPSQLELVVDKSKYELFSGVLVYNDHFIYTDIFNRRFKLEPVTNENIKFPFIITPLGDEK